MIGFNNNNRFISRSISIKFIFRITVIGIWNNLMIIDYPVIVDYAAVGLLGYEGVSEIVYFLLEVGLALGLGVWVCGGLGVLFFLGFCGWLGLQFLFVFF